MRDFIHSFEQLRDMDVSDDDEIGVAVRDFASRTLEQYKEKTEVVKFLWSPDHGAWNIKVRELMQIEIEGVNWSVVEFVRSTPTAPFRKPLLVQSSCVLVTAATPHLQKAMA